MSGGEGKPAPQRMRKPSLCDSCRAAPWPAFGIGCPCLPSERPPELRHVHLWHCGAPACEADCRARYAVRLRDLGRGDLADKLTGAARPAAPRPDLPARADPPSPGAARAARKSPKPRLADDGSQGALFGA